MLNISGLFQTMTEKYISTENLLVLYNFEESGSVKNKAPNYLTNFSGVLNGSNNFYLAPGTGFATGHYVSISGTGFWSNNFSHVFVVQKSGQANDNFFSSIAAESGAINSGYLISANNAGKMVFSFKDCSGPQSVTSSFNLNNITNFAITKNDDTISMYQFTPISNILDSDSFQVVGTQIFQSNYSDLLYAPRAPAGFLKDFYSGFINNYLYFNISLSPSQVVDIISGLYTTVISSPATTGNAFDECTGLFSLPQSPTVITSGNPPPSVSLTKNGIVLLRSLPSGSNVLVDYDTGNSNISWNNQAGYNFSKGNFVLNATSTIPPIVYLNGQRVISGFGVITGQFCSTGKYWEYDYQYSGNKEIDDADSYNQNDVIIYDIPGRNVWQQLASGSGSVNINTGSGLAVYLNGQRILDYTTSGSTITLIQPIVPTDIICKDYYQSGYGVLGEVYTTGFFFTSGSFVEGTSRVYMNGIRLLLNTDYLEIVSGTLLQGYPLDFPLQDVVDITGYNLWNL